MTNTQLDVAQVLANLAESQKAMLDALQSVTERINALEQASSAPASASEPAPVPSDPRANWPDWAKLANVVPDGYTPLFGVTVSDGYIQGYGFSYRKVGDVTYLVMKGFSFNDFTSKEGKTFPAGARGKSIRLTLEQWTALFHVLQASLEAFYGSNGIPAADVSMSQDANSSPATVSDSANSPVDPTSFVCPECGQAGFKKLSGIKRHYTTKHKGLVCPVA